MPRNFIRGAGVQVLGMRELQARVSDLIREMGGDEEVARTAKSKVNEVISDATDMVYRNVVANARRVNVPHEVYEDIFTYKKPHPSDAGKRVTALVGIKKRGRGGIGHWAAKAYAEWYPKMSLGQFAKGRVNSKGKWHLVTPGTVNARGAEYGLQKIGENLATMWELGTTKAAARPFFRPAITETMPTVVMMLANGFDWIMKAICAKRYAA